MPKPIRYILLLFACFVLGMSAFVIGKYVTAFPSSTSTPQQAYQLAALSSPLPIGQITGTPAATPTPTQDDHTVALTAQSNMLTAQNESIAAQQAAQSAQQKILDLENQHIERTAVVEDNTRVAADRTQAAYEFNLAHPSSTPNIPATKAKETFNSFVLQVTLNAPTQIVAIARAQSDADAAPVESWAMPIALLATAFFLFCMGALLLTRARHERMVSDTLYKPLAYETEAKPETTIANHFGKTIVTTTNETQTVANRLEWPCTDDQLTALARGVVNGLAISYRNFTGAGKPFDRDTSFPELIKFLDRNSLVVATTQGSRVPTPEFKKFCVGWLQSGTLPPQQPPAPKTEENTVENTHDRAPHDRAQAPEGEAVTVS
jgi:hypothetical protein